MEMDDLFAGEGGGLRQRGRLKTLATTFPECLTGVSSSTRTTLFDH